MMSQIDQESSNRESIFESIKEKIYPWIKVLYTGDNDSNDGSAQLDLKGDDTIIMNDWLGDLCILYVADVGDRFQVLLQRDLPKNMTKIELHQLAINNLVRNVEFKLHDTNFGAHGLIAGGDHEAGSICVLGMWEWLTEHFNDNLIVGVPAKDLVIMVAESETDTIANLKIFVHEVFKSGERLLTKNIFRFDRKAKEWTIIDSVA